MSSLKDYKRCLECGKNSLHHRAGDFKTFFYDGKKEKELIVPNVEWEECASCGKQLIDYNAIKKITDAKYKARGLFTPDEIKHIRNCLSLTQKEISKLVKVGEKTWTRWENGTVIQTQAHNEILRALVIRYGIQLDVSNSSETEKILEKIKLKICTSQIAGKIYGQDYSKNFRKSARPDFFRPRLAAYAY